MAPLWAHENSRARIELMGYLNFESIYIWGFISIHVLSQKFEIHAMAHPAAAFSAATSGAI
jgi:hypothetical protein